MNDRDQAIMWARGVLKESHEYVILDTETTDLNGEAIDVAIITLAGDVLFQSLFNPELEISPGAAAIHGLTRDLLQHSPRWEDRRDEVEAAIGSRTVLIYNARFDAGILHTTCRTHHVEPISLKTSCVMEWYAQFYGEWNDYHGNYRWQRLDGGDHSALGDWATLDVIKRMATAKLGEAVHE